MISAAPPCFGSTALPPSSHRSRRALSRKDGSSLAVALVFCHLRRAWRKSRTASKRHSDVHQPGATMSLTTAIGHLFRRDADRARFERLDRLLAKLGCDLGWELEALAGANERIAACAAFAFEALENGENRDRISARLDALAEAMDRRRERLAFVMLQHEFVNRTRKELARLREHDDRAERARKARSKTLPGVGPYAVWRRLPHDTQA
jgi:predicted transcriptional regulator